MSTIVIVGVALALLFDFLNGMNDAANSIATVVATRVLSPFVAVIWAAFFNFAGAFGFGLHVANTMGQGIICTQIVTPQLVLCALVSAVIWTHICTGWGLPISVSHALIGGMIGAAVVQAGFDSLIVGGIVKIALFIFLSPILGMILSAVFMFVMIWLFSKTGKQRAERLSKILQLFSAAGFSLSHGLNDAQKTMGIISILLFSAVASGESVPHWMFHGNEFYVPTWVIFSCYSAISLGTLIGGRAVIRTMGMKITKLRPLGGFAASAGGGITIMLASLAGIPVSTTHTITGSIAGVGVVSNVRGVRWDVAGSIVWAWILTIPVSAVVGALAYWLYLMGVRLLS